MAGLLFHEEGIHGPRHPANGRPCLRIALFPLFAMAWTKPWPGVAWQVRLLKGRYALGQHDLGKGSFGAVYAAEDTTAPGTRVAVKVCCSDSIRNLAEGTL
jgi:hypothetical protein